MEPKYILEMIEENRIEELKVFLNEEIKQQEIKLIPGVSARYKAMKEFYKYVYDDKPFFNAVSKVKIGGEKYNLIFDPYSIVFTKESVGTIPTYEKKNIPDVMTFLSVDTSESTVMDIDMEEILYKGKKQGYKRLEREMKYGKGGRYYLSGENNFYKFGLIDKAFSIINDGTSAKVFEIPKVIYIKTTLGMAIVLGLRSSPYGNNIISIPLKEDQ
jgi:hypothetical protein